MIVRCPVVTITNVVQLKCVWSYCGGYTSSVYAFSKATSYRRHRYCTFAFGQLNSVRQRGELCVAGVAA